MYIQKIQWFSDIYRPQDEHVDGRTSARLIIVFHYSTTPGNSPKALASLTSFLSIQSVNKDWEPIAFKFSESNYPPESKRMPIVARLFTQSGKVWSSRLHRSNLLDMWLIVKVLYVFYVQQFCLANLASFLYRYLKIQLKDHQILFPHLRSCESVW